MFLAHLFRYKLKEYLKYLDGLNNSGIIDGVEVYHSSYSDEQTKILEKYCKGKGLLMSGGTDCHGDKGEKAMVGVGDGGMNVPESIVDNWL